MKYSKIIKAGFIAGFAVFAMAGTAMAQSKTLVVDYNKVINQSKAGKSIAKQLKAIATSMQNELNSQVNSLKNEEKAVKESTKGIKTLADLKSRPDLQQKIQNFKLKEQKTALDAQYKDAEMKKTQAVALSKVAKKMNEIIANVARERGADLVVDVSTTVYASPSVDISSTVMSRLDSQMPNVVVTRVRLPRKPLPQPKK